MYNIALFAFIVAILNHRQYTIMYPASPKISVILPTYNRPQYLRQAIESILHQTFKDLELIIVDDASSNPEVLEIIQQYKAEYSNVRVMRHTKNLGVSVARNIGIENARGTYIMLMDDDDISLPNRARVQYEFLESHPDFAAVTCGYSIIDSKGIKAGQHVVSLSSFGVGSAYTEKFKSRLPDESIEKFESRTPNTLCSHSMFRRSALLGIGGYRRWFRSSEDLDLTLRMQEKCKLGSLSLFLYEYRYHPIGQNYHNVMNWYYAAAACISAWHRHKRLRDPIDRAPELTDVLKLLESMDASEDFHLMLLGISQGACYRALRARDYAALCELLRVCHRYCVRKTDQHTRAYLKKLCFNIFLRAFKYRSFGWLKYHFSACR